jgi:hypothetical protein
MLGLQNLSFVGVKHVEAFDNSLLVVQQVVGVYQCLDGSLNAYIDTCLEIIALFDDLLCTMFIGIKVQWQTI